MEGGSTTRAHGCTPPGSLRKLVGPLVRVGSADQVLMAIRTDDDVTQVATEHVESVLGLKLVADPDVKIPRVEARRGKRVLIAVVHGTAKVSTPTLERVNGVAAATKAKVAVYCLAGYAAPAIAFADIAGVALHRIDYGGAVVTASARSLDDFLPRSKGGPKPVEGGPLTVEQLAHVVEEAGGCAWCDDDWAEDFELGVTLDEVTAMQPAPVAYQVPGVDGPCTEWRCWLHRHNPQSEWAPSCDRCHEYLGRDHEHGMHNTRLAVDRNEAYEYGYQDICDRPPFIIDVFLCPRCDQVAGKEHPYDHTEAHSEDYQSDDYE